MILTVLGDRFATGEHLFRPYTWAIEDQWHHSRGLRAHPENIPHCFGYKLSKLMHIGFHAGATKDSTVQDIIQKCVELEQKQSDNVFVISWGSEHIKDINDISHLGRAMDEEGVKHCFINSQDRFPTVGGRWLWDTQKQDLVSWANSKGLMDDDHLSTRGHSLLANLCLEHLTNQFSNIIVVA